MKPMAARKTTSSSAPNMIRRNKGWDVDLGTPAESIYALRPAERCYRLERILHDRRNSNSQNPKGPYQLTPDDRNGQKKKLLSLFVLLAQDGVTVIEGVEELSELKHMLCQIRWLGRRDALFDD